MKIFRFNFSFGLYFCLKIDTKIMLITLTKQSKSSLLRVYILMKESLICFKKLNEIDH